MHRENLHPLDQFRAFKTLKEQNLDVEEIARAFFVSAAIVKQRWGLPRSRQNCSNSTRRTEIREQIMAFSISNDHARPGSRYGTASPKTRIRRSPTTSSAC